MIAFLLQAGTGGGDGNEGWSLQAVISIPLVSCVAHTSQDSASSSASLTQPVAAFLSFESAQAKGTVLSRQHLQDPCVGSQVNPTVYTSLCLFPGRICQAWLVFTLAIWSFISQPHTCCSSHLDCWAFAIFLVSRCYLLGLLGFPS